MDVGHAANVIAGSYDYRGWGPLSVGGHLELAWERITASQDLPSTHPDPKGPFTRNTDFDDGFMW